jgi:signal transduction histidine kinase
VRDEGPGFPPEFIGKAFERFTRADPARGRGGSGLGLSIVQMIARAHGGDARAANDAEGGARVTIELPVAGPGAA